MRKPELDTLEDIIGVVLTVLLCVAMWLATR